MVIKLAKEGNPADKIGMVLRDQYGVPLVKAIMGRKISQILKDSGLVPKVPEDISALLAKADSMKRHLEKNRGDRRNIHNLQLLESRIHRLVKYYQRTGRLAKDWKYAPKVGIFM